MSGSRDPLSPEACQSLRDALQAARIGVWSWNATTGHVTLDPRSARVLGLDPGTYDGDPHTVAARIHADDLAMMTTRVESARRLGATFDLEFRIRGEGDGVRWMQCAGSFLPHEGGAPERLSGVLLDVTEAHRMKEQLERAARMESIGVLAGGIAHDFNNILQAISAYSEILLTRTDAGDPRARSVLEIRRAVERAAGLTRQLLAFSRRQVLQPRLVNLNLVLGHLSDMLRRLIGEDIEFVVDLDPAAPWVLVDPSQLEQVVMNLAINARDAMPQGGRLEIATRCVTLGAADLARYPSETPGPRVELRVTDNGCGMPPEVLARVFEPFFTTKGVGRGTGLGLATSYGIVKQSGGSIWAESAVGAGTTFRVFLPLPEVAALPEAVAPGLPRSERGDETILLVEDDAAVRHTIETLLGLSGYVVHGFDEPLAALRAVRQGGLDFDLLLTDIVMPGMSGHELATRLRELRPDCAVLYVTGYAPTSSLPGRTLDAEVGFLAKPFVGSQLLHKVREVLDDRDPLSALSG